MQIRTEQSLQRGIPVGPGVARRPRRVQGDRHPDQWDPEEDAADEREMAVLRLHMLLLYAGLFAVAGRLSQ